MEKRVIYYDNELEDEFSDAVIEAKPIDGSYQYEETWLRKLGRLFFYRIIAIPIAYIFLKIKYAHKIVNRRLIRQVKKQGYFLYGNHTHFLCDALIPTMISLPTGAYVIVHANNVSMPVLGRITPALGAIPLPDDGEAARNFMKAVKDRIQDKKCVTIYPEAHIWPYYTGIRPYTEANFRYPVQYGVPTFAFTNTYQKRRFFKTPKIVTYVDGPFYPREGTKGSEARIDLRNQVYNAMVERSSNNSVELIKYVKRPKEVT